MRPRLTTCLLGLLLLGACNGTTGPESPSSADPATRILPPHATPPPEAVSCRDGDAPAEVVLGSTGHRRFTGLLATWDRSSGAPHVDLRRRTIHFLRDDGSAHSVLRWTRAPGRDGGSRWFADAIETCPDAGDWRDLELAIVPVELTVGHCWLEPLELGGANWDVTEEDQFGWGGGTPQDFAGRGPARPAGGVAIYTDTSGQRLTLVPAGHAWAVTRKGCR